MGYDMYLLRNPREGEMPAAQARWDEAIKARDEQFPSFSAANNSDPNFKRLQDEVWAAMRVLDDARGYFRLNVWGMSTAREELFAAGVMCDAEQPPYPRKEDYGLGDEAYDVEWSDEQSCWIADDVPVKPEGKLLEYLEASKHWRDDPPPGDHVGIPLYKMGSNDGWLVTLGEIRTALAWANHHHEGWRLKLTDYVERFVAWMELAADCDGFRVY